MCGLNVIYSVTGPFKKNSATLDSLLFRIPDNMLRQAGTMLNSLANKYETMGVLTQIFLIVKL